MKSALAALFVLSAGAAQAGGPVAVPADPVVAAPAAAAGYDWTGFYVGLSAMSGDFRNSVGGTSDTNGFGLQAGYLRDFGNLVLGGELAYAKIDYDDFASTESTSTRLKLIGGYGAGRFMPYAFVGLSSAKVTGPLVASDTMTNYGLGAKVAVTQRIAVGLEYLVEDKNDFDGTGLDIKLKEIALRVDYRF
ncbi:outer membrane protein [Rhodobacter calidifons]|uniref:Porin family protein n=1 Tax=Rhodobacter calidifons TaxID=2715277 RepID=A0ABX0G9X2_9RHOB|nr:outer membrane beta-barrel protein [Rhodobacter calidifons]NHB77670.1 porin family protein [Rhodobacter calidifons]